MKTLYNGKTKTVMLDEATGVVNLFFKDSATGENGLTPAPTPWVAVWKAKERSA